MISLITAYRNRKAHWDVMRRWLERIRVEEGFTDFEWIVVEGAAKATLEGEMTGADWLKYAFHPMKGLFCKSLLLNLGAGLADGSHFMPLDTDLLPARHVLSHHARLALEHPALLFTGYRLMLAEIPALTPNLEDAGGVCGRLSRQFRESGVPPLGPEENASALCKYLLAGERFGVMPLFSLAVFRELGGYDEQFAGWGAEDQDLFERYCGTGATPVRCHDLLYLHMPHGEDADWKEPELTVRNREYFYGVRRGGNRRGLPAEESGG